MDATTVVAVALPPHLNVALLEHRVGGLGISLVGYGAK